MDTTRAPRPSDGRLRVLLAGPVGWREQFRSAFAADDAFAVQTVETVEEAVGTATDRRTAVDCVVSAGRLDGETGLDLLDALRSHGVALPFVLVPADGSESLASDAIAAGVADYLPADADGETLRRRCREAVERGADERRRRERADQFESFFATPEQFSAVLDADGTVRRVNRGALDALGRDEQAVLGKRFWGLPWTDDSSRDLQRAIHRARRGEYAEFEAGVPGGSGDGTGRASDGGTGNEARFEFTVRPVAGEDRDADRLDDEDADRLDAADDDADRLDAADEEVGRLVVAGREVAERVRLEEELRESEELHRVTLNNMTDTVLVTDDDGEFTYVCPNVHFIFGYSAEEIHGLGTIDELLGEDLFDPDRLDAEGVLTNIECTATDEDGREHTLLVNVRQVSIQGGTTLYSCRDITKRKQRERALTQLHRTSRDLLYAETKSEIADRVVTDADSILPAAAALYRFDSEENVLYPTAVSDEFTDLVGVLPELRLDRDSPVTRAFVEDETRTCDLSGRTGRGSRPDTTDWTGITDRTDHGDGAGRGDRPDRVPRSPFSTLGDYVAVPLGDHGVFVAAAADGTFDEVAEEVAELLAATTEAAFDRVERDGELRERDRRLQRQNERLSQLNRVNEFIREIDQALVGAESREKIETAVCERLTADDRFRFAWIGGTTALNRTLRPRTWAGAEQGYLDAVPLEFDGDPKTVEPSVRTAERREATLVSNVAEHLRTGRWGKEAVSRDFQSVLSIPLAYDDVLFGTLTVYADSPDAFDEMVRSVLRELGDTVASAINAVQRKEALQSDTVFELEYRVADPSALLARLASETGATIAVEGDVTGDDGTTLVFATVEGAPPDRVVAAADESVGVADAESIRETDEGGLVGLRLREKFVTAVLADHGAVLRRFEATPEGVSLTVDVPDSVTTRSIDEVVSNTYDGAEPVAQRERTRALDTRGRTGRLVDDLTERQLEVAQMAYHAGFFDSKRDVTGREVAEMLDISHTAFYDHVRRIERKLFASLFENRARPSGVE
ncbi:PAS domain S-box protein [Halorussus gelatinilyticus]|uniref:PAS domain S-box protein n=1 Tax=Halorussus gelatinilyticus TaxID=2937524 RepID=A0A8U0IJ03_9EURY|nr:bacterio-opsin activator domain-containing protein [Halorussus gelatinilyticus]UPW00641.1 PAS domain S-box protein [Halorussus gelatinilyticus]